MSTSESAKSVFQFQLRSWLDNDLSNLVKHANNKNIAQNMTDLFPYPYTEKDGLLFLNRAMKMESGLIQAIVVDGNAVGSIGIFLQEDIFKKNAEMGYWLAESYWGNGIMSMAIQKMTEIAFERFDIDRIFARPFGSNHSSQRVLEKNGFVLEARLSSTIYKNSVFQDELIYAIRRK